MNLLEIREQARSLSGRFDLINADFSDNGFDFHLKAGQKWLDRKFNHQKTAGRVFRVTDAGDYNVTFPYCRSIKEVWMADNESRWQLEKMDIQDFRDAYPEPWNLIDTGDPLYYTPAFLRSVPETNAQQAGSLEAIIGYADIMIGDNYEYNGILYAPRATAGIHVEVWGYFYTEPLTEDTDQNYWSVNHPDILIMGALRQIEIFHRNTHGKQAWESAIMDALFDVDKDMVEEELSEVDQMEG